MIAPGETAQWVGYEAMFGNMEGLDRVADDDDKKGNHEGAYLWRTHDARAAGLSDTEAQILNEAEVDCNHALKEQEEKFRAALRSFGLPPAATSRRRYQPNLIRYGMNA